MKRLRWHLCAAALCIPIAATGCHNTQAAAPAQPAAPLQMAGGASGGAAGGPGAQAIAPAEASAPRTPEKPTQSQDPVKIEVPRAVSVPNPLYHPGRSESLDISGTLSGQTSGSLSGTITLIVTRESSHGRPINVMNTTVVLKGADGSRKQFEHQEAYEARRDGKLKLLYKTVDDKQVWVDSSTCVGEPRDYVDGHSDGYETHFDDGSVVRTTSAVAVDGDYLKVTSITKTTDKSGDRESTETLWLDPSTGHYVRYSGAISGSDGNQLTLTGR